MCSIEGTWIWKTLSVNSRVRVRTELIVKDIGVIPYESPFDRIGLCKEVEHYQHESSK